MVIELFFSQTISSDFTLAELQNWRQQLDNQLVFLLVYFSFFSYCYYIRFDKL